MALAPKSNAAYKAVDAALADIERRGNEPPPPHLRDANYRGAKNLGHGKGYRYPHAFGGWVEQQYLPDAAAWRHLLRAAAWGRAGARPAARRTQAPDGSAGGRRKTRAPRACSDRVTDKGN